MTIYLIVLGTEQRLPTHADFDKIKNPSPKEWFDLPLGKLKTGMNDPPFEKPYFGNDVDLGLLGLKGGLTNIIGIENHDADPQYYLLKGGTEAPQYEAGERFKLDLQYLKATFGIELEKLGVLGVAVDPTVVSPLPQFWRTHPWVLYQEHNSEIEQRIQEAMRK